MRLILGFILWLALALAAPCLSSALVSGWPHPTREPVYYPGAKVYYYEPMVVSGEAEWSADGWVYRLHPEFALFGWEREVAEKELLRHQRKLWEQYLDRWR